MFDIPNYSYVAVASAAPRLGSQSSLSRMRQASQNKDTGIRLPTKEEIELKEQLAKYQEKEMKD